MRATGEPAVATPPGVSRSDAGFAFLEVGADGWCMAHFPAAPGAGFKAPSAVAAAAMLETAWQAELDWLAARGLTPLPVNPARAPQTAVAGNPGLPILSLVRTGVFAATGDTEAYVPALGQALTPDIVEMGDAYLKASRAALLDVIQARPAGWLDARPAQGKRTPREVLHHIADAELWYLVRLTPDQHAARDAFTRWSGRGEPEAKRLSDIRLRLLDVLASLLAAENSRITVHDPHAEVWTPFKVLYRAIWHERYTTKLL